MSDKWDKDYTVITRPAGEVDVILATLPPDQRRRLWAAIKAKNPAKAELMRRIKADAADEGFDGELIMTNTEIAGYLQQA